MSARDAISSLVGAAVSLVLHIPAVRRRWEKRQGKVLILLTLHIGGALAIWTLECLVGFETNVPTNCTMEGLARMGWTGTLGFIANQTTYGISTYGVPAAKSAAEATVTRIKRLRE